MKLLHFIIVALAAVALLLTNLAVGSQDILTIATKGATMIGMYYIGLATKHL